MIAEVSRPPTDLAGYDPVATAGGAFRFDTRTADLAVEFIESECVHVEDRKFAGKPLKLQPWQADVIRTMFGWKRADGTRRYRTVYIEVPRKNGKSTMLASIVLLMNFCPQFSDPGGQMFSAAGDREQAGLVYKIAAAMVRKNRFMNKRCKIRDSRKRIVTGDSFYAAVASGEGKMHGTNPSLVVADELHVWKGDAGRALWDEFISGMGARSEPLMLAITTAGYDRASLCWEQHQYAVNVRDRVYDDPTFLPVLYFAEDADDWTSEEVWRKANPNYGVSVRPEFLREECEKAKRTPLYENTFRRLYLNQWTEQAVRWMPMEAWRSSAGQFDAAELVNRECYGGLDIASTRDLASFVLVFPMDDGTFRVLPWFFCPHDAATMRDRQDRQSYTGWIGKYIIATEGNEIDQQAIRDVMLKCRNDYDLRLVHFDQYNMTECRQQLIREGWPEGELVKFPQNAWYNEPMQRCLELIRAQKLHHGNNPVLTWNAANVVAKIDHNGNIKPDKSKSQDKIDGFCAMLMALGGALFSGVSQIGQYYETNSMEMG